MDPAAKSLSPTAPLVAPAAMRGGISFLPFPLISREVISHPAAEHVVLRCRFGLASGRSLGLEQPTTHVKIRIPREKSWLPKARTFSLTSPADAAGHFECVVKVHRGGRVSEWLQTIPLSTPVPITRTLTKRLKAPLDAKVKGVSPAGRSLALVAFGVGVTECLLTASRAAKAGQRVRLVWAVRRWTDVILLEELAEIVAASSAAEGGEAARPRGSFSIQILLSREDPGAEARAAVKGGGGGGGIEVARGRITRETLAEAFRGWDGDTTAVMAVGSKAQRKEALALLRGIGLRHLLLGKPVVWGCW